VAQHFPIELSPREVSPWRLGNTGIDYVHAFDSGRPGPNVMVQALTHGNGLCGAIALDWLLREASTPDIRPGCA
jgi:predicted deacylase